MFGCARRLRGVRAPIVPIPLARLGRFAGVVSHAAQAEPLRDAVHLARVLGPHQKIDGFAVLLFTTAYAMP